MSNQISLKNFTFHLLKLKGMRFPLPSGKVVDWGTRSSFFPEGMEITLLPTPLKEVKMAFPLEIRGFHPVIFQ